MNQDPAREAKLERLVALFREIGGYDPEGWAEWEVDRNSPQLAYFLFFRRVWRDVIGPWRGTLSFSRDRRIVKVL